MLTPYCYDTNSFTGDNNNHSNVYTYNTNN